MFLLGCGASDDERPTSTLLITLDTTTPLALSCYDASPGLTPNLDRIASEGLLFENARTVAPLTLPAHSSILTGLYPVRHSVRRNGASALPASAVTVAERARDAGYQTGAVVAAVVLDGAFGLEQGFETYDAPATPSSVQEHLEASRPADDIVDAAIAWLGRRDADRPFFLWVHFFDPHFPYRPPPTFLARAGGDPYLGESAFMDHEIGRLLAALDSAGVADETVIAVVGDHGEGLGRHGESTHAAFVFDSTLDVPLFVRHPEGWRAGERSAAVVSVVDVFPTLIQVMALGGAGDVDGRSLFSEADPARGVYFESYFGTVSFTWSQIAGWADAEGKYIHSSVPEFYDIAEDPEERNNRVDERQADAAKRRAKIAELSALPRLSIEEISDTHGGLAGQIERLGYAGAGLKATDVPEPLAPSELPSPHRRVDEFEAYQTACKYTEAKRNQEAVALLQRVVRTNPKNHKAQFYLGLNLKQLQRWNEAVAAFQAVLRHSGGERISAELNLALCYQNLRQDDLAIHHYESALKDTIGPAGAMQLLIDLYERKGRTEDAERCRARLRTTD